ncbi:MAG: PIN domain-containing protein [Gemmatimonadales bacterium]|nr:MAG: PIN domain-containing protein [Gemmatimonadales bacterium]
MKILFDTHFLVWTLLRLPQIDDLPWLDEYRPWGVSAVSLLELAFLSEVGRLELDAPALQTALGRDPRFQIDEIPTTSLLLEGAPSLVDPNPFDRLLAAHSLARGVPLCTLDRRIREHHALQVPELAIRPLPG